MLTVRKLASSGGGSRATVQYTLNRERTHRARDGSTYTTGYYSDRAPSAWHGELAGELGLAGEVDAETFQGLLDGQTPGGERFADPARGNRRMGNDLTFSAPKSVSLQALAGGDSNVIAAHDQAVARALEYLEKNVVTARYGRHGVQQERTGNAAIATFRHEDARPVAGRTDPSLHTHSIFINATRDGHGRLRATELDFGHQAARMHAADAVYKAVLANELERQGYATRSTENGFELAHITDEQIHAFSSRHHQIEEAIAERGQSKDRLTSQQELQQVLNTREGKADLPRRMVLSQWHRAAAEVGLDFRPKSPKQEPASAADDRARALVDETLDHFDERASVHRYDDVFHEATRAGIGRVDPEAVRKALDERPGVNHVGERLMTDRTLAREHRILERARAARGRYVPAVREPGGVIQRRAREQGVAYSADQREAIGYALGSSDQITGIVGAAGAGKTTAITAVAHTMREQGYQVVGLAPSSAAAGELNETGTDRTDTLAAHLTRGATPNDPPRYYVLDEAGMVDNRQMEQFLATLRETDRVLLVGDPKQLQAVEAGKPFAQMMAEGAIAYTEMSEIRRQRDPELRRIAEAFAEGATEEGTQRAMEYAETIPTARNATRDAKQQALAATAAARYRALDPATRQETLVVAGTNKVRNQVNEDIRAALVEEGAVDASHEVTVQTLHKSSLTSVQRRHAHHYQPGMVVRLAERNGETVDYPVAGHDTESNLVYLQTGERSDAFITRRADELVATRAGLYTAEQRRLGRGDRILFNENDRAMGVRNGDTATVRAIENGSIQALTDRGRRIELDRSRNQTLDYAYARTVHKAQGHTAEHSIVVGEANRVATAEQAYVSTTRERSSLHIITDDPEQLRQRWARYADRRAAREVIHGQRDGASAPRDWQRVRHDAARRHSEQERGDTTFDRPATDRDGGEQRDSERAH